MGLAPQKCVILEGKQMIHQCDEMFNVIPEFVDKRVFYGYTRGFLMAIERSNQWRYFPTVTAIVILFPHQALDWWRVQPTKLGIWETNNCHLRWPYFAGQDWPWYFEDYLRNCAAIWCLHQIFCQIKYSLPVHGSPKPWLRLGVFFNSANGLVWHT